MNILKFGLCFNIINQPEDDFYLKLIITPLLKIKISLSINNQ